MKAELCHLIKNEINSVPSFPKYQIPLPPIKEIIDIPVRTSLPQIIYNFREILSSNECLDQNFELLKQRI
jgi:hypothetical protein